MGGEGESNEAGHGGLGAAGISRVDEIDGIYGSRTTPIESPISLVGIICYGDCYGEKALCSRPQCEPRLYGHEMTIECAQNGYN